MDLICVKIIQSLPKAIANKIYRGAGSSRRIIIYIHPIYMLEMVEVTRNVPANISAYPHDPVVRIYNANASSYGAYKTKKWNKATTIRVCQEDSAHKHS